MSNELGFSKPTRAASETAVAQSAQTEVSMWDDDRKLTEIKSIFAPKLTDLEFSFFIGMGKATGLNPFLRELWAVKYGGEAQIFIGRDGYRKAAQAHPEYDYHQVDAVYANDKFGVSDGVPTHSYTLTNRGNLVGAYALAKRKSASRPVYVFAELKEYTTGRSTWKDKPATMIKKVAECQCLRACFQDLFGGSYGVEEMDRVENKKSAETSKDELLDKIKQNNREPIDITPISERVKSMVAKFEEIGVSAEHIETRLGCSLYEITPEQIAELGKIYKSIKNGAEKCEDFFKNKKETK